MDGQARCPGPFILCGFQSPASAGDALSRWMRQGIPWIAESGPGTVGAWLDAGAWGVIPPGTPATDAERVLESLGRIAGARPGSNPLTGLPGNEAIATGLARRVIGGRDIAAYVDITDFKPFNDYYGFARGDGVIRLLAAHLSARLEGFFVGHVGGDDFVVIGSGPGFEAGLDSALADFRRDAMRFYSQKDLAAGGIETLDRYGRMRFFPVLDACCVLVRGEGCRSVEDLAERAGVEKKRRKGEGPPLQPSEVIPDEALLDSGSLAEWIRRSAGGGADGEEDAKALIEAAGVTRDSRMTDGLRSILADGGIPAAIRKSAVLALGMMRSPDASAAVAGALADANPHVRTMAVQAASELEGPDRCSHLESAVKDWSTWVRRSALRALGTSRCPSAEGILLAAAEHGAGGGTALDLRQERIAALEGLSALHSPSAGEKLLQLKDPEPALAPAFWRAIASSGGDRCCAAMAGAIGRSEPAALQALQSLHAGVTGAECTELLDSALTGLYGLGGPGARAALTALAGVDAPASGALRKAVAGWLASPPAGDMDLVAEIADRRAVDCGAGAFRSFFERSLPARQIPDDVVARLASILPRQGGARPGVLRRLLRHPGASVRLSAARSVVQVLLESGALRAGAGGR